MNPGLYQREDGTPLFGEWLSVFAQPDDGKLKKYPRNLGVPPGNEV